MILGFGGATLQQSNCINNHITYICAHMFASIIVMHVGAVNISNTIVG